MVYVLGDNALYYKFLNGLGTDILYANTQKAFVWQSVEKGYYESLAYLFNYIKPRPLDVVRGNWLRRFADLPICRLDGLRRIGLRI